ncbi:hypothetical protein VCHENC02_0392B, partial [Vibrio harveyi]
GIILSSCKLSNTDSDKSQRS